MDENLQHFRIQERSANLDMALPGFNRGKGKNKKKYLQVKVNLKNRWRVRKKIFRKFSDTTSEFSLWYYYRNCKI